MLRRIALSALALALMVLPAAAGSPRIDALAEALRLDELLVIMRDEGLDHAAEIAETLLEGRGGAVWDGALARIYAPERMRATMLDRLAAELAEAEAAAATGFYASDLGRRLVELEIGARRAMLDEAVDAAARAAWADMRAARDDRVARLRRFAELGDMVEENVVGGLNATYAFYMGLIDSGAAGLEMSQGDVLADVWAQEPEIRAEIEDWLFSYLALAFAPLADAELDAYIAFFETEAGQALNTALFAAFNTMFEAISRDLGLAAGRLLQGEEL